MDLDKIIHDKKNFAELEDADVEDFLTKRRFGSEHLNLEFKAAFPRKDGGKYEIKKICKYIVGYSNEQGGLVVYGVSDDIKRPDLKFPEYITGIEAHPSLEDLSQWVKERIHPLIASPSIRFFSVANREIAIVKIPPGVNKPYSYFEPDNRSVSFFKKTPGGIELLAPDQIREFHRTQIIDQSELILRAALSRGWAPPQRTGPVPSRITTHKDAVLQKLEDVIHFGFLEICSWPSNPIDVSVGQLQEFLERNRSRFSESLHYFPNVEISQSSVSVGYFPRAVRQDTKSTMRTTLYKDGLVAFDAQVDTFMEGDKNFNPVWVAYELQRHLQLTKVLLKDLGTTEINTQLTIENVEGFSLTFGGPYSPKRAEYVGPFETITRSTNLSEIYDDQERRNLAMPVVRDIMDEISRVFGLSKAPADLWDASGILTYVKGLENQR